MAIYVKVNREAVQLKHDDAFNQVVVRPQLSSSWGQRNKCFYCDVILLNRGFGVQKIFWESRDHIVPKDVGGGVLGSPNLVPACHSCNDSKQATPVWVWAHGRNLSERSRKRLENRLLVLEEIASRKSDAIFRY